MQLKEWRERERAACHRTNNPQKNNLYLELCILSSSRRGCSETISALQGEAGERKGGRQSITNQGDLALFLGSETRGVHDASWSSFREVLCLNLLQGEAHLEDLHFTYA